jgi:hypothetical protein
VIQLKLLIDHLFFECCYFGGILYEVLRWFGFSLVLSIRVVPHATQFSHSYLFGKDVCLVLILFGLLVVGPYGNTRNDRLFKNKVVSNETLIDKIKVLS